MEALPKQRKRSKFGQVRPIEFEAISGIINRDLLNATLILTQVKQNM